MYSSEHHITGVPLVPHPNLRGGGGSIKQNLLHLLYKVGNSIYGLAAHESLLNKTPNVKILHGEKTFMFVDIRLLNIFNKEVWAKQHLISNTPRAYRIYSSSRAFLNFKYLRKGKR